MRCVPRRLVSVWFIYLHTQPWHQHVDGPANALHCLLILLDPKICANRGKNNVICTVIDGTCSTCICCQPYVCHVEWPQGSHQLQLVPPSCIPAAANSVVRTEHGFFVRHCHFNALTVTCLATSGSLSGHDVKLPVMAEDPKAHVRLKSQQYGLPACSGMAPDRST